MKIKSRWAAYEIGSRRCFGDVFGADKLGVRTGNTLFRGGVRSITEARSLSDAELLSLREFGARSLARLRACIGYAPPAPETDAATQSQTPAWMVIC